MWLDITQNSFNELAKILHSRGEVKKDKPVAAMPGLCVPMHLGALSRLPSTRTGEVRGGKGEGCMLCGSYGSSNEKRKTSKRESRHVLGALA
jgi:hypothetical protein